MQKRWSLKQSDATAVESLQKSLNINRTICHILTERGIDTFDKAKAFFRPSLDALHDPWLMKDMQKAVDRILLAKNSQEKVLVFGDYDVDGTTSVASMYQFLQSFIPNLDFYIPHRYREGYGISKIGIDFAKANGFSLIVSLDCGIKSVDLIGYAKEIGIDFIVCDHHLPDQELPPAVAILNPKQTDCAYPYKDLCGCGVGFKLMQALAQALNMPAESYLQYLDLVATAIAADIVSLSGENRILAYYGLKQVNNNPCAGIKALMDLASSEKEMHLNSLVFIIAPRINAAGRMDDARKAVQLFIEKDTEKAKELAEVLHSDNTDRREADATITEEALALIEENPAWIHRKSTVVYQPHWHKGVVGIVASRLIDSYYRPTIVLTKSGDYVAGSARSVAGFNLYEAVHACKDYLLGYGGHFAAAGMTLLEENVAAFSQAFEQAVQAQITDELLIPEIVIDAELSLKEITNSFYSIICQMEPFGPDNMRPTFVMRNVKDTGFSKVVKEQHIRFSIKQQDLHITGIGFNMAHKFPLIEQRQPLDIVFTINLNEWNGEKSLQMKVIDFKLSEA